MVYVVTNHLQKYYEWKNNNLSVYLWRLSNSWWWLEFLGNLSQTESQQMGTIFTLKLHTMKNLLIAASFWLDITYETFFCVSYAVWFRSVLKRIEIFLTILFWNNFVWFLIRFSSKIAPRIYCLVIINWQRWKFSWLSRLSDVSNIFHFIFAKGKVCLLWASCKQLLILISKFGPFSNKIFRTKSDKCWR